MLPTKKFLDFCEAFQTKLYLHRHAEWAKSRKLKAGNFLFQFSSPVMVGGFSPYVTMQKPYLKRAHALRTSIHEV